MFLQRTVRGLCLIAGISLIWIACDNPSTKQAVPPMTETPVPEKPFDPMALQLNTEPLQKGRLIWMETCAACHLEGLGDAPLIANKEAWADRIEKGMTTLYQHAIEGFYGSIGEMPPRGGNESLSDEEIKLAVDFVIHCSR
ncbi:MAG: c-type cytochrome [Verrucomicrobiota bacterium]